jgi:hypothetical protein
MRLDNIGRDLQSRELAAASWIAVAVALLGVGTESRANLTFVPGSVLATTEPVSSPGQFTSEIRQYRVTGGQLVGQIALTRTGATRVFATGIATIGGNIYVCYSAENGSTVLERGVGQVDSSTGAVTPLTLDIPTALDRPLGLAVREERLMVQSRGRFAELTSDGAFSPVLTASGTSQQITNMNFATDVAWNGSEYLINMYRASDVNPVNTIYRIDPVTGAVLGEVFLPAALPSVNQSLDFDIPTGIMRSSGTFFENGAWVWGIRNLTPTPGYFDSILNNGSPTFTDIATWTIPSPAPATLGLLLAGRIALRRRR